MELIVYSEFFEKEDRIPIVRMYSKDMINWTPYKEEVSYTDSISIIPTKQDLL